MFRQIKVAAISLTPKPWDKAYNADRMEAFFRKAARRKPDLMLTTEGILEGYVAGDVRQHPEKVPAMFDIAETLDGPSIRRFRKLAKALHTCLCFGFAEKIGRSLYNSAVFIDHRGAVCGRYHKHEETILVMKGGRPTWTSEPMRRRLRAFDTPLGRCGIIICADRWYSRLARALVLDGARFLLVPAYGTKNRDQNRNVLSRARENGVPLVQANVGMNLIISRGEIVTFQWGADRIATGLIDIPLPPSTAAARRYEQEYRRIREEEQWAWLAEKTRTFPAVGTAAKPSPPAERGRNWDF